MAIAAKFESLDLSSELLLNLESLGYKEMTPIQEKSLPAILEHKDVIAQAKTGSGKTAAFGIGIVSQLNLQENYPQALVICPTRELAEQVSVEMRRLARFTSNIKVLAVFGGAPEHPQQKSLEHGAHIVVGTPGRLHKLLKKKWLDLSGLKVLVLDEADRMLDMGFYEEITQVLSFAPSRRQTLLFSATFPDTIKELSKNFQKNALSVKVDVTHQVNIIKQIFYKVENSATRAQALMILLANYKPQSVVIFCRTKAMCNEIVAALKRKSVSALTINGDLEQRERTLMLTKFANKSCSILVATDVASRGLDIKDLDMVINYELSNDPEVYVHRIGRTGRAGQEGIALSLYDERDKEALAAIESYMKCKNLYQKIASLNVSAGLKMESVMSTIAINGGRKEGVRPGDILGALTSEPQILGTDVGDIKVLDSLSYVAVTSAKVSIAAEHLQTRKIKGRKFKVSLV